MEDICIEVENVNGHCVYSYHKGDTFTCHGYDTPDRFYGGAYTARFPIIVALPSGAWFDFEKNPLSKTGMAVPTRESWCSRLRCRNNRDFILP